MPRAMRAPWPHLSFRHAGPMRGPAPMVAPAKCSGGGTVAGGVGLHPPHEAAEAVEAVEAVESLRFSRAALLLASILRRCSTVRSAGCEKAGCEKLGCEKAGCEELGCGEGAGAGADTDGCDGACRWEYW